MGYLDCANPVPQQTRSYGAVCIKDELEVESARRKGASAGREQDEGAGGAKADSSGGKAAGRGKTRQLHAAEGK